MLDSFKKAMEEYKGNVSAVRVRNIVPSGLEDLFKGVVVATNILFKEGEEITFKYYAIPLPGGSLPFGASPQSYPIVSGIAYIDGSVFQKSTE